MKQLRSAAASEIGAPPLDVSRMHRHNRQSSLNQQTMNKIIQDVNAGIASGNTTTNNNNNISGSVLHLDATQLNTSTSNSTIISIASPPPPPNSSTPSSAASSSNLNNAHNQEKQQQPPPTHALSNGSICTAESEASSAQTTTGTAVTRTKQTFFSQMSVSERPTSLNANSAATTNTNKTHKRVASHNDVVPTSQSRSLIEKLFHPSSSNNNANNANNQRSDLKEILQSPAGEVPFDFIEVSTEQTQ